MRAAIPAYYGPGTYWDQSVATTIKPAIMIMDVTTQGAGTSVNAALVAAADAARAAGISLYGYIDTTYGARAAVDVMTEVTNWGNWYGVTNFFLDQVQPDSAGVSYYTTVAANIRAAVPGTSILLNQGTDMIEAYAAIGDILIPYENTGAGYLAYTQPAWMDNYPANRFYHIVHTAASGNLASYVAHAKTMNVGYLYITDDCGANPYDTLPAYWDTELGLL